ncbi:AraC family transcriptional regulator [Paenibacillus thiaminolyticus]|uniref:AraC family transcriptional regulator n=2 Tax=Paenibacillus thiaminolyticus TaxID=49283 RepID=A0A3A3GMQ3_PANTH|nr:AraC family transcriptional regulator [Paenibacillus thiaminolyticus]
MEIMNKLPNMEPIVVRHEELKLIGIPCINLQDMSSKYRHAKESLLSSTKHFPQVVSPQVQYGIWPNADSQADPDRHAYILCVEVSAFEGIPEWYMRVTMPPQLCVVVANDQGDFDAASSRVDAYVADHQFDVSAAGRDYIICERYSYDGEGFARYSLPIILN